MKILVLTGIRPTAENRGSPGFLLDFYIECLREDQSNSVDVRFVSCDTSLNKLCIYIKKERINNYDAVLVYPFHVYFAFKFGTALKVIVLGPDSVSFLMARFQKIAKNAKRIRYMILKHYFHFLEGMVTARAKFIVVGRGDELFSKIRHLKKRSKIVYLRHPFNERYRAEVCDGDHPSASFSRRLVFVGDLSQKYVGDAKLSIHIVERLRSECNLSSVLFVGKRSRWLFEAMKSHFNSEQSLEFAEWIEDLLEISQRNYDIHAAPIRAGAGTKNRVLMSVSFGIPVVGTAVAFENIRLSNLSREDVGMYSANFHDDSLLEMLSFQSPGDLWANISNMNDEIREQIRHMFSIPL